MTDAQKLQWLRESLTRALIALEQAHGYAIMDSVTEEKVKDAMNDAHNTLALTDE